MSSSLTASTIFFFFFFFFFSFSAPSTSSVATAGPATRESSAFSFFFFCFDFPSVVSGVGDGTVTPGLLTGELAAEAFLLAFFSFFFFFICKTKVVAAVSGLGCRVQQWDYTDRELHSLSLTDRHTQWSDAHHMVVSVHFKLLVCRCAWNRRMRTRTNSLPLCFLPQHLNVSMSVVWSGVWCWW